MPQNHLQLALEHHRAGRVSQAETGYRAALSQDPDDADALHWLGVLFYQAGDIAQALPLLQQAVYSRPDDAAFHHNLGQACLAAAQFTEAIRALERSSDLDPMRPETFLALGQAYLARHSPGDANAAILVLRQASIAGLDSPELHLHLSTALLAAGRAEEAIAAARAALERRPDYPLAHHHLALAFRALGKLREARAALAQAASLQPNSAAVSYAQACLEIQAGEPDKATTLLRRAISLDESYLPAFDALAALLAQRGKPEEAQRLLNRAARVAKTRSAGPALTITNLEQKLTLSPQEDQLRFALAAYAGVAPPGQVPASSVADLFDRYADNFDNHLRNQLQYRVPELIFNALSPFLPVRPLDILDLGCGTGLSAPLLRPIAATLAGVDLSPAMIEKAKARNLYDRLDVADLVTTLQNAPRAFDLLIAADVLNYLGDLTPAFQAAAAALRPAGLFAFTAEAGAGDRYQLQSNNFRFRHAETYLKHIAAISGFTELSFATVPLRTEAETQVMGHLMVLRLPASWSNSTAHSTSIASP